MRCKNCIHYDVCHFHIDEETSMTINECDHFKNKADFVEVVRCRKCMHRSDYIHGSCCLPIFGLKRITDLNAFCSYGERKDIKE